MSIERYLTGNRVYRGGSSAPTMGTVDPQGYVERELRKRMLLQEPSQTRSGLAQAALQRIQGGMLSPQRQTMPYSPGETTPQRQIMPTSGPQGQAIGLGGNSVLQARIAAVKAEHLAEQQSHKQALLQKQASRPKVSPVGKVTSTKAKPKPTALPWDLEAQNAKMSETQKLAQLRNQILQMRQGAQRNYSMGMNELDQAQPEQERGLLNQFGGRGLAHSSGYGMGVGGLQNQFAGMRSGLQGDLTSTLNDASTQEAQGVGNYNQRLALIQQALAQRLSRSAGKLGWGPTK